MTTWASFDEFLVAARETRTDIARQQLVNELLREHPYWPWVEGNRATFIYVGKAQNVALNLDIIENDPPFAPMTNLDGTDLWYVQRNFAADDLLDYLIAVDDPMTPLAQERDIVGRIQKHWRVDTFNPARIRSAQMETSVVRMRYARPFPDWVHMRDVPRGDVREHDFSSVRMGFNNRKVWVYTPPDYDRNREYPLLVLLDGQWMIGPLQIPLIADTLIKHNRLQPLVIAMKQSGSQTTRMKDYVSNDQHYAALLTELLPLLQADYNIDATNLGIGGVAVGAIAAAHAALKNPAVFSHLIMLSPPLGKGRAQEKLVEYADRFENAPLLPKRIFQSVGRYEMPTRFYKPGLALAGILQRRQETRNDIDYRFAELGSGHGLVAFKSILPESLAHTFPGEAFA